MARKENYMDPAGGLLYGVTGNVANLVLHNFTSGLVD